jgi:hypothetical protein
MSKSIVEKPFFGAITRIAMELVGQLSNSVTQERLASLNREHRPPRVGRVSP